MAEAALSGKLQALYVVGANLAFELPDTKKTVEALKKLKLLVVQDIFMSETAQLAHVVLPAASFAEKEGTFTNSERRVQRIMPAMKLQGGCKPDGEIIASVSGRMGRPMEWGPSAVMDKISVSTPIYSGITYDMLTGGGVQWPYYGEMKTGAAILHADALGAAGGAGASPGAAGEGYPFVADITVSLYHSGTTMRRTRGPNLVVGKPFAALNPADAAGLGLEDGAMVTVRSRSGQITLPAKQDPGVPRGMVHMPNHFAEAACNVLTETVLDPVNKAPAARYWPVSLEKA
jgi:predicted molibdopterin-dependent oxidoreductase YjgC